MWLIITFFKTYSPVILLIVQFIWGYNHDFLRINTWVVSISSIVLILVALCLYFFSFVETPRKFIIAELSIRKLGSSSVLIIRIIISTDEDPSLRIESTAIITLRGVSTKLNKYIVFTMQTYKKLSIVFNFSIFNLL